MDTKVYTGRRGWEVEREAAKTKMNVPPSQGPGFRGGALGACALSLSFPPGLPNMFPLEWHLQGRFSVSRQGHMDEENTRHRISPERGQTGCKNHLFCQRQIQAASIDCALLYRVTDAASFYLFIFKQMDGLWRSCISTIFPVAFAHFMYLVTFW